MSLSNTAMQREEQEESAQKSLCDECQTDCSHWENAQDFKQWQENELCCECTEKGYREYYREVFNEPLRA
jgi:hypothetical protein